MERGRPSKLTEEVKDKLVKAISQGNYYEAACSYAGISYSTFREWMNKGAAEQDAAEEQEGQEEQEGTEFSDFLEAIKKAESAAELRLVQEWQKHIPNNWQAIATFMERRYPDRWGRRERRDVNVSGEMGIKIVDDVSKCKKE